MNWPDIYSTYLELYQKGLKKDAKSIELIDFLGKHIDNILDVRRRDEVRVSLSELRDVAIRHI